MAYEPQPRMYLAIDTEVAPASFVEAYRSQSPEILDEYVDESLRDKFEIADFPSLESRSLVLAKDDIEEDADFEELRQLILPLISDEPDILIEVGRSLQANLQGFVGYGADLAFDVAEPWCPGGRPDHLFGTETNAKALIRHEALSAAGLVGNGVNVVIVDRGLDQNELATMGGTYAGGWPYKGLIPGQLQHIRGVTDNYHGMMVARNILRVAPAVKLYDCPLIPARIANIQLFTADAQVVFNQILTDVGPGGRFDNGEQWILVNAWGIFDRASEVPLGNYTENLPPHPFNDFVATMVGQGIDMVFAAGNCGQFCPDRRSGPYDRGPGRSIWGANAHPRVLTVGAVRADGLWIGASSQGPGPEALAPEKPDLCGPSQFSDDLDRHEVNGGTSAACAVAAGVLAALRQEWRPNRAAGATPTPDQMNAILRQTAWRREPPPWDQRRGRGVIDAQAARIELSNQFPP